MWMQRGKYSHFKAIVYVHFTDISGTVYLSYRKAQDRDQWRRIAQKAKAHEQL